MLTLKVNIPPETIKAEGKNVLCAAISVASCLVNPINTPPSANASTITATNAGPDPARAVAALNFDSGRERTRPQVVKIAVRRVRVEEAGRGVMRVMPWPIW